MVVRRDRASGAWVFIALHDDTLGVPTGGTRLRCYRSPAEGLWDAQRLAEGMSLKWAGVELAAGGGKGVIALARALPAAERRELLRRYGRLIESLHGSFATGPDLGTTPDDMLVLAGETRHVHGLDRATGRVRDPGPYTARGVLAGMRAALRAQRGDASFAGRTILVEGIGDVGAPLAASLAQQGARLLLSDLDAARVRALAGELGAQVVEGEEALASRCDIYAPCAVGATLNRETIARLGCAIVAGSANNQLLEPQDAERLAGRGILYAPDFIINAGGAIAYALLGGGAASEEEIGARIDRIEEALDGIFAEARSRARSPAHVAVARAEAVLARAREARARRRGAD